VPNSWCPEFQFTASTLFARQHGLAVMNPLDFLKYRGIHLFNFSEETEKSINLSRFSISPKRRAPQNSSHNTLKPTNTRHAIRPYPIRRGSVLDHSTVAKMSR
jgi:hypothetical protein